MKRRSIQTPYFKPFSLLLTVLLLSCTTAFAEQAAGFVPNHGQLVDAEGNPRPDILFSTTTNGATVYFFKDGFSYVLSEVQDPRERSTNDEMALHRVDMRFLETNADVALVPENARERYTNYYYTHCPDGILQVPEYGELTYRNLYPGIDLVLRSRAGALKYDFVVQPGADVHQIKWRYEGAQSITMSGDKVTLQTSLGDIDEDIPLAYAEDANGKRLPATADFIRWQDGSFSFLVLTDAMDARLVIDPLSTWATYFGGSNIDYGRGVVGNNFIYQTGETQSNNFPVTAGAHQTTISSGRDAYVAKWNKFGGQVWTTYYGGTSTDAGEDIDMDPSGNVYITGRTRSGFPVSAGAYQTSPGGGDESFLVKFDPNGTRLWATYVGGEDNEEGRDVTVDGAGNAIVVGWTESNFQIATGGAVQTSRGGNEDIFIMKFNATGTRLWGSYYGGSSLDEAESVDTDGSNNILITGRTYGNWPVGACCGNTTWQSSKGGGFGDQDIFVLKLNPDGNQRLWSTYYGGSNIERGFGIAVDAADNVLVTGNCDGNNFPTTFGTIQPFWAGGGSWGNSDAVLVKFAPTGSRTWSTYYGGSNYDQGMSVHVIGTNEIYMVGETASGFWPSQDPCQSGCTGTFCGFVVHLNGTGSVREMSSFIGGAGTFNSALDVHADNDKNVFITGFTSSSNFPVGGNIFQSTYGGGSADGFLGLYNGDSCLAQVLPTEFISITAERAGADVAVQWETGVSIGLSHFEVERSVDGRAFAAVGTTSTDGGDHYRFTDPAVAPGTWFYRIRAVDFDGEESYSEVAVLRDPASAEAPVLYPNPARDHVDIYLPEGAGQAANVRLFGAEGRLLRHVQAAAGSNFLRLELGAMAAGIYIVEVRSGAQRTRHRLLVH